MLKLDIIFFKRQIFVQASSDLKYKPLPPDRISSSEWTVMEIVESRDQSSVSFALGRKGTEDPWEG